MIRFRCEGTDEYGAPVTRSVRARDRDRAVLLLLADGVTPASIIADSPSLLDRTRRPARADGLVLLRGLAAGLQAGLAIREAARRLEGGAARAIADGGGLQATLAGVANVPTWASAALGEAEADGRAADILPAVTAAASSMRRRRTRLSRAVAESVVLPGVAMALVVALSGGGIVLALIALAGGWLAGRRDGRVARLLAALAAAEARLVASVVGADDQAPLAGTLAEQHAEAALSNLLEIMWGINLAATVMIGIVLVVAVTR